MIYTPGCGIGGQESPTVYQVCICKPFLLLQPSAEEYIVSPKALIPNLKQAFRNISLSVWQAVLFAEAPAERVDEITYFSLPAVM